MDHRKKYVSKLVANNKIFECTGRTVLKITRGGNPEFIMLPIKSTGVSEYQAGLANDAPRPPVKIEMVKKDSDLGRSLGLTKDDAVQVFDTTDEKYIDELNQYHQDSVLRIAVFALDIEWEKEDGSLAQTLAEKMAILKSTGLTGAHLDQIYTDVMALARYAGKREDFLSGSLSDTETNTPTS